MGMTVVALSTKDGSTLWQATDDGPNRPPFPNLQYDPKLTMRVHFEEDPTDAGS